MFLVDLKEVPQLENRGQWTAVHGAGGNADGIGEIRAQIASQVDLDAQGAQALNLQTRIIEASGALATPLSRAFLFDEAMGRDDHPLHREVTSEWRGMAAMVATDPGALSLEGVDLRTQPDHPLTRALQTDLGNEFPRWNPMVVLVAKATPVAVTSPRTWLYTTTRANVPEPEATFPAYARGGRFQDPSDDLVGRCRRGNDQHAARHLERLLGWMELMRERARQEAGRAGAAPGCAFLVRQLDAWVRDLHLQAVGGAPQAGQFANWCTAIRSALGLRAPQFALVDLATDVPVARLLLGLQVDAHGQTELEILGATGGHTGRLLLDKSVVHPDTLVFGNLHGSGIDWTRLATQRDRGLIPTVGGSFLQLPDGWRWLRGADFFTPAVCRLDEWKEVRSAPPGNGAWASTFEPSFTLPLAEEFLRLFHLESLFTPGAQVAVQGCLQNTPDAQGVRHTAYRFSVRFRLTGREVTLTRSYSATASEQDGRLLPKGNDGYNPYLAMWPNFRQVANGVDTWRLYYLFHWNRQCNLSAADSLVIRPLDHDGLTETPQADKSVSRLFRMSAPPAALRLEATPHGEPPRDGGVVPLEPLLQVASTQATWEVGVDFGTSSTAISWKLPGAAAQIMTLKNFTRAFSLPRQAAEHRQNAAVLATNFRAMADRDTPFPTLLMVHSHELLGAKDPRVEPDEVLASAGTYLDTTTYAWKLALKGLGPRSDLKWSESPAERKQATLLLADLLLLLAAQAAHEGANTLKVRWAYPSLIDPNHRAGLNDYWSGAAKATGDLLGPKTRVIIDAESRSEAVCALRTLSAQGIHGINLPVGGDEPCIFVDVGGGTTDVAVWSNSRMVQQFAVRLGGNNLLPVFVSRSQAFREVLGREFPASQELLKIVEHDSRNPDERARVRTASAILNSIFTQQDFGSLWNQKGDLILTSAPGRAARTLIYGFWAGVHYYLGLSLQRLWADQVPNQVHIGLAGRGASLMDWLPGKVEFGRFLKVGYLGVDGTEPPLRVQSAISKLLKQEVALGLWDDKQFTVVAQAQDHSGEVVGERGYCLDQQRLDPSADLGILKADAARWERLEVPQTFPNLEEFYGELGRQLATFPTGTFVPLPDLAQFTPNLRGILQTEIHVHGRQEAPFILGFQHLLNWMSATLAGERQGVSQ